MSRGVPRELPEPEAVGETPGQPGEWQLFRRSAARGSLLHKLGGARNGGSTAMAGAVISRLSSQDAQILRREAGPIRGHSCKVLVLERTGEEPLPTLAELRAAIEAHLSAAPRLRQRLVSGPLPFARPVWADDPEFDISRHVTTFPTSGPVSQAGLERITGEVMTGRLDRGRPLWHIDVVRELADGSMALIWRMHHCMADGSTMVAFASAVLWSPEQAKDRVVSRSWTPQPLPPASELLLGGLRELVGRLLHPGLKLRLKALLSARTALTRELSRTAAVTSLASRAGPTRSAGLISLPLADCKLAGKAVSQDATLNDVLLAILAGGLAAWLARRGAPARGIRVKVPVSLHEPGERGVVANRDSFFFVDLPVTEPGPAARLEAICRQTTARKDDRDADALYELSLHRLVSRWAMSPRVFTLNLSNVRGPAQPVWVLGCAVRELYALSEIAQGHALRIAAISSADSVSLGLLADGRAVPDMPELAGDIRRAAGELLALAN
jgi:diacylglycerol O-acyltransferase